MTNLALSSDPSSLPASRRTSLAEQGGGDGPPTPTQRRSLPPRPLGPRERQGSMHTKISFLPSSPSGTMPSPQPVPQQTSEFIGSSVKEATQHHEYSLEPDTRLNVEAVPMPRVGSPQDELPSYEYRSPEAVIEPFEEQDQSNLPPGVLEEHLDDDARDYLNQQLIDPAVGADSTHSRMALSVDTNVPAYNSDLTSSIEDEPELPQIGLGAMPRLFLSKQPHDLVQPIIKEWPKPPLPSTPSGAPGHTSGGELSSNPAGDPHSASKPAPASSSQSTATFNLPVDEIYDALPGGLHHHNEWYFCPHQWAWFHIAVGRGHPPVKSLEQLEHCIQSYSEQDKESARSQHIKFWNRYKDIEFCRALNRNGPNHLHPFHGVVESATESRIERAVLEGHKDTFTHKDEAYGPPPEKLMTFAPKSSKEPTLWVSCMEDVWLFVDQGPIPGQVPPGLAAEFTAEKERNPNPGISPETSAVDGWHLIIVLLQNALFKGKTGWVRMDNKLFMAKIGASLRSSHLLERIGFGCKSEEDGSRVGPFTKSESITNEDANHMRRYMIRAWVETRLYLQNYRRIKKLPQSDEDGLYRTFGEVLEPILHISAIPELTTPFKDDFADDLYELGVSVLDTPGTIEKAYDIQLAEHFQHLPILLNSLEQLSHAPVQGRELLQIKVATERSLDRYTTSDVETAYNKIGLTKAHVESIMLDREDIPADHVLELHRNAMDNAKDNQEKAEISRALVLVGKDRDDELMIHLGKNGGTFLSLDQAYKEFNLSRDVPIDNELLILHYETWISDRPSRADHYRMALSIIANVPGEEKPVLQAYLSGKDISEFQGPARRDIPAGLRNIGNTCYLNSVLQFLYTIQPLRDAVMSFEDATVEGLQGTESARCAEKRIKVHSSQRFVSFLRDLFNDMYTTDSTAVTPQEELARLAIVPIDLIDERANAIPRAIGPGAVTVDSLPTIAGSPASSGGATAADSAPPTPLSLSAPNSPARPSPTRQNSILGKRASQDRDSVFGGSEERLRRLNSDKDELIDLDSPDELVEDIEMGPRQSGGATDSSTPAAGMSQLELGSPAVDGPPQTCAANAGMATPSATPPPSQAPVGPPPLPPRRRSMALMAAEKFGLQQDAAEILVNVLAQLEYALDPPANSDGTQSTNLIQSIFTTKFRQQMFLQPTDGSTMQSYPPVESVFVHPIIGVEEDGKDLYDCLAEIYLGGAEIEYEGKKGYKMDLIDNLPPMLYIQMRRSQYDAAKGRQTKTNTHVPFGKTLVMDRFLAGADPVKRESSIVLTRDMMRMRARRHELKNHKPKSIPDTFRFVRDALATSGMQNSLAPSLEGDNEEDRTLHKMLEQIAAEADEAEAEITLLDQQLPQAKAKLESLWSDGHAVEYELVSVFVHGGTGTGGHYWTYQADLPKDGNKFFYYSDDVVKEVPAEDVFGDKSAQGVAPALLCYVRKNRDLVDTLHRKAMPGNDPGEQNDTDADEEAMVPV